MRWQQENRLKSEFALFQSLLRLSLHTYFIKCRQTQLELNSYGTYPRTYPSFKREIRFSSLLVYVLHKTRNWALSRRSNANTAKKCTKSVMHVQSCCFDVLFAVTLLDEWIFKSLQLHMTCTFPLHCPINAEDDPGYLQAIRSENSAIHVVMISSTMT